MSPISCSESPELSPSLQLCPPKAEWRGRTPCSRCWQCSCRGCLLCHKGTQGLVFNLCPPAHTRPFLPSHFPARQPLAHPGTWGSSTPGEGCAFGFADLHKASLAHFSSLAQSLQPRPVHQDLLHGASSAHQCPSLWHPRETGPSAHPGTTPSQAQPICTTDHCASRTVPAPATPSEPMGLWHFPEACLPSQHSAQMG